MAKKNRLPRSLRLRKPQTRSPDRNLQHTLVRGRLFMPKSAFHGCTTPFDSLTTWLAKRYLTAKCECNATLLFACWCRSKAQESRRGAQVQRLKVRQRGVRANKAEMLLEPDHGPVEVSLRSTDHQWLLEDHPDSVCPGGPQLISYNCSARYTVHAFVEVCICCKVGSHRAGLWSFH